MKKKISLLLALLLCLPALPARADSGPAAMILYEPRTGTVLEEKNADARLLVASTTKIMTALVALEHCAPEEPVTVTPAQTRVEGSSMYLKAGQTYTVEELLTGLLLASGNDAAAALAEHTAGSLEAFAGLMNEKCDALGLKNTHFVNPHGLDDPAHYSSARDLAILTAAAMENAVFSRIFACRRATVRGVSYTNHNKLLNDYPGCIGGKTGYTRAAGRVLVSCAEREGLRLVCVTISDPDDWADHAAAYDAAFDAWQFLSFPAPDWQTLPVLSGTVEAARLRCSGGVLVRKDADVGVAVELPRFVFAPLRAGSVLGRVTVRENGQVVFTADIYSAENISRDGSVALTAKEQWHRAWDMYCRYGLYTVYPMER